MQFTNQSQRRAGDPRRGQAIFIFIAAFTIMAGMLGLALDGGRIFMEKRRAQAAADAGAAGAVQEMRRGLRDYAANVRPAAVNDAGLHNFTDSNSTITVNNPPVGGSAIGNGDFVEVIVAKQVPTTFMRWFGPTMSTVRARAGAGLQRSGDACVIALDPTAGSAIWANGTPELNAACGIVSNSTAGNALRTNGQAIITGTYLGTPGGYSGNGFTPTPETNTLPIIDPFLNITFPTNAPNGYTTTAASASSSAFGGYVAAAANGNANGGGNGNGNGNGSSNGGGGGSVLHYWPGYYSAVISISNGVVVFEPGIYILEAGMRITGGVVTGSGVTFYNKNTAGGNFYTITGNADVTLSAPTDNGDYHGMLLMGPRVGNTGNPGNMVRGTSNSSFTGALYLAGEHLDWAGNSDSAVSWGMVVANTINVSGTSSTRVINPPTESQAPKTYRMAFTE
jgi:Flp pilus assembly protein TadG